MKTGSYAFRHLEERDIPETIATMNAVFPRRTDAEWLKWKLLGGADEPVCSAVAECDGRIVGLCGNITVPLAVHGRIVPAALGVDFAILPEHRRMDIFLGLMNRAVETFHQNGAVFAYGFPNEDALEINTSVLGFQTVAPLPAMVNILRPAKLAAKRAGMRWRSRESEIAYTAEENDFRIDMPKTFDDRFDRFQELIRGDYPIMSIRDAAWLNRRYATAPGRPYRILVMETADGRDTLGYMIWRMIDRPHGERRARVLDIMTARSAKPEIPAALIRHGLRAMKQDGADSADCWMFSHVHLHPFLRASGFISRAKKHRLFQVRRLRAAGSDDTFGDAENAERWHLCIGDGDFA